MCKSIVHQRDEAITDLDQVIPDLDSPKFTCLEVLLAHQLRSDVLFHQRCENG